MKRIVIAGGAGFLGQALARHFEGRGWDAAILTRSPERPFRAGRPIAWDGCADGPWTGKLDGAEAVVNLCGRSVNCRYHRRNRERIRRSRLEPTAAIARAIAACGEPPKVWLNASSATIYQASIAEPMREDSGTLGEGFSVEVCKAWEDAFFRAEIPARVRRVALRSSMVLGHGRNSVYPVLARLARCWMGGKIGPGNQMVSWIHVDDFTRAVVHAIGDQTLSGPLNVTAPAPVPNALFMATLRQSLGIRFGLVHYRPLLAIAAWLLRTESELTQKSRFAYPAKLLERRFVFTYPFLDEALQELATPVADFAPRDVKAAFAALPPADR